MAITGKVSLRPLYNFQESLKTSLSRSGEERMLTTIKSLERF